MESDAETTWNRIVELTSAIEAAVGVSSGPFPRPRPELTEPIETWNDHVQRVRARHDSAALLAGAALSALTGEPSRPAVTAGAAHVQVTWASIPVAGSSIGARIYRPMHRSAETHAAPALPAILYAHGGAYWMGGGATGWALNDAQCRFIAHQVGAVVVSVDYRLAPEHRYPTPGDDVVAALQWLADSAIELNIDADRLALYGVSSGGNLAATAAQRSADGEAPAVCAVVLQVPSLDLSPSSARFENEEQARGAMELLKLYVDVDSDDVYKASPGLRSDLSGLAPHLLISAEWDWLRTEGAAYAQRLADAGVDVTSHTFPTTHTVALAETSAQINELITTWLRKQFS